MQKGKRMKIENKNIQIKEKNRNQGKQNGKKCEKPGRF